MKLSGTLTEQEWNDWEAIRLDSLSRGVQISFEMSRKGKKDILIVETFDKAVVDWLTQTAGMKILPDEKVYVDFTKKEIEEMKETLSGIPLSEAKKDEEWIVRPETFYEIEGYLVQKDTQDETDRTVNHPNILKRVKELEYNEKSIAEIEAMPYQDLSQYFSRMIHKQNLVSEILDKKHGLDGLRANMVRVKSEMQDLNLFLSNTNKKLQEAMPDTDRKVQDEIRKELEDELAIRQDKLARQEKEYAKIDNKSTWNKINEKSYEELQEELKNLTNSSLT